MTGNYTRCKTIRFEPETFELIEKNAAIAGVLTSEYIRSLVERHVGGELAWYNALETENDT